MPLRCATILWLCFLVDTTWGSDLQPFPVVVDGKERHVIHLPRAADESRFMVELVPGKTELVDCNLRSYRASIQRRILDGWGYSYYVLGELEPGPSTRKACSPNSASRRFVPVLGEGLMLPYNSRVPLVVYLPPGLQLKYRVWRGDKILSDARAE